VTSRQRDSSEGLTPFQIDVARAFFDLPTSAGFLLAGGGALERVLWIKDSSCGKRSRCLIVMI
jgi:hypothetical protein